MELFDNEYESEFETVSQITNRIKQTLERNYSEVNVIGEISNFKSHISGHWYFTLKDSEAQISCTMWRGLNNYVFFTPENGMKVTASGKLTVYPPRGSYQIDVRSMKPAGVGELQAAFERLKRKLFEEGLFSDEFKKTIPKFPGRIGIVTAIDGAAFKDMISVAERRYPVVEIVIAPCKVQGSGAAESIIESIQSLNKLNDIDVIIVGRGGGSMEDLWAFNEEKVARAIFASQIPIISGIGHDIDFTIADFVADFRAPTPSAAMELATPDKNELFAFIDDFLYNSTQSVKLLISGSEKRIHNILDDYGFRMPLDIVRMKSQLVDNIIYRLIQNIDVKLNSVKYKFALLSKVIDSHDQQKILKKGFVLVRQDSSFVPRLKSFQKEKQALLKFYDGEITVNQ